MLDGVIVPVQQALYSILYFIAVTLWGINQALILVGYYLLTITSWLSESMFQPLLESVGNSTDSLLLPVFTLAMLTLAITYLLGVFGVFRVVEFRSAITWMFVAVMWFQFGPELYLGFEQTRRELGGAFFATTFTDLTSGSGSIEGLSDIGDAGDLNISPPANNFGAFLSFDTAIDGLDIALAYLNADGCDILRTTGCLTFLTPDGNTGALPTLWYTTGEYFDVTQHGYNFAALTNEERQSSLDAAAAGIWRALSGIVVSLFGMLEQIVQLLLTIAFGIGFASFFIAILFAFFKKTESVTWAVFDVILGLFIQSIITSLLLALVMAFVSVAGATGNGILLLGVGFIGIILVTVLLLGAISAILKSLNGLMGSFGAVTGGSLDAAGTVTQLAGAYATGGATLLAGGTAAQALGSALGPEAGQKAYYAAQTFGSETAIGGAAQQVAQGAMASYLGPVGGYALGRSNRSDDDTENATDVARKNSVNDLTLGTPIRSGGDDYYETPNLNRRASEGADIRVDPITQQPYEFGIQDNGIGLRTYEDGSRLYTSEDDEPQNRERARDERRALRQQGADDNVGFSQDAINRIDASDDDESAALNSSISRLSALVGNTPQPQLPETTSPDNNVTVVASASEASVSERRDDSSQSEGTPSSSDTRVGGEGSSPDPIVQSDESTRMFVAEMERDYPGSTGRSDLVEQYFPTSSQSQPQDTSSLPTTVSIQPIPIQTPPIEAATQVPVNEPSSSPIVDRSGDDVRSIRSVGPSTEEQLATINITTAGQLANADPAQIASLDRITPARANQLVNSAQAYVAPPVEPISQQATSSNVSTGDDISPPPRDFSKISIEPPPRDFNTVQPPPPPPTIAPATVNPPSPSVVQQVSSQPVPPSPNAAQVASAIDASNNDDGVRLATSISSAISSASNANRVPSTNQAMQIASDSGLPPIRESGQFVQVASAMNLTPQQAQGVVRDVQNTGSIGNEIATSIRASLSSLTLPSTGQPLDDSGMSRAVGNLERAAQALVGAANSLDGAGSSSGNPSTGDRVNAGANTNNRTAQTSES